MAEKTFKILVVDDEPDILEFLSYNLEKEGFQVETAENGKQALEKAKKSQPDIVLLDVMMPEMDGIEACRTMREMPQSTHLEVGNIQIDRERYLITFEGKEMAVPRKEFELLYLLASKPGKVFKRDEILNEIWGRDIIVGDRTIDVHIRKLREKLGEA